MLRSLQHVACHICIRCCCPPPILGSPPATSAPALGSPPPHQRREWARPCDIGTGTRLTPAHIGAGTGLTPCPHLHRDWAHSCHCTGTALTPATSAPACRRGRPLLAHPPSLRADGLTADCVRRVWMCGTVSRSAYPSPHGLLQRLVFVSTDPVSTKPAATTVSLYIARQPPHLSMPPGSTATSVPTLHVCTESWLLRTSRALCTVESPRAASERCSCGWWAFDSAEVPYQ